MQADKYRPRKVLADIHVYFIGSIDPRELGRLFKLRRIKPGVDYEIVDTGPCEARFCSWCIWDSNHVEGAAFSVSIFITTKVPSGERE